MSDNDQSKEAKPETTRGINIVPRPQVPPPQPQQGQEDGSSSKTQA